MARLHKSPPPSPCAERLAETVVVLMFGLAALVMAAGMEWL